MIKTALFIFATSYVAWYIENHELSAVYPFDATYETPEAAGEPRLTEQRFMTEDGEFLTVEIFDHPVPGRIVMWLATRSEDIARHTGMVRQYKGLYYLSMVDFRVQKNDDRWILLLDRHCQRGRGADRMVFSPMSTSGNWKTAIHQPGNSDALVLKQDGPEFCSINNDRAGRHPAMVEELMGYLGNGDTSSEVTVAFANDSGQRRDARANRLAIHMYCAGTTLSHTTAKLGACKRELFTNDPQQGC